MIPLQAWHWAVAMCVAVSVHALLVAGLARLAAPAVAPEPLQLSPVPGVSVRVQAVKAPVTSAHRDAEPMATAPTPLPTPAPPVATEPLFQMDVNLPELAPMPEGDISLPIAADLPRLDPAPMEAAAGLKSAYDYAEVDRVPGGIYQPPPDYPLQARRRQLTGLVRVRLLVGPEGKVRRLKILTAEPPGVFEQAVKTALGRWRFEPGQVGGQPVSTWVEIPVRFDLEP